MGTKSDKRAAEITQTECSKLSEESKAWEAIGANAWGVLSRLGSSKLTIEDLELIAQRLWIEKEKLKAHGIPLGELCVKAGLGKPEEYSKALGKMTLSPGKTTDDVRLLKSAYKYRRLIEAIGHYTTEDRAQLANRLLAGTSLHPTNRADLAEADIVFSRLQEMVDAVDREFDLLGQFLKTAEMKVEHLAAGGRCWWPHYGYQSKLPLEKRYAFWEQPVPKRKNPLFWWPEPFSNSGCIQNNEFFYIPHAHLGRVEMFNLPDRDKDWADHDDRLHAEVGRIRRNGMVIPSDEWDKTLECPIGQTAKESDSLQDDGWLVIYPTPNFSQLMPMLYIPLVDGYSFLLPLDVPHLQILTKAYWITMDEVTTVYERIKQMIFLPLGDPSSALANWRRTAPWFARNPFYKLAETKLKERARLATLGKELDGLKAKHKPPKRQQ